MEIERMASSVNGWWGARERNIIEQYVILGDTKLGWPGEWMMARELIPLWQIFGLMAPTNSP